jgi:pyruvate-formate lyase-activating enzyme
MSPEPGLLADVVPFSWVDGPGNRYVLFLQGCNFNCTACHNPHTIPLATSRANVVTVQAVLEDLRPVHRFLSGVTVSGGEATLQPHFVHDLFAAVKDDAELGHLTTFIDSNGAAPREVWDQLLPVTDGVMVDLKALDADLHVTLTGAANDPVLSSIRHLAAEGKLYEVRLLLVPGINDGTEQLRHTADWLLSVDPGMRIKVIAFRRHGARAAAQPWPEATAEQRDEWQRVLEQAGIRQLELV